MIPPHARIALRRIARDANAKPKFGERIKYLIVRNPESTKLTECAVSVSEYMKDHRNDLNLNEYVEKHINPPLARLFTSFDVDVQVTGGAGGDC